MLATVFDTETTGLVNFKADYRHLSQPDIIQLGCKLIDIDKKIEISGLDIMVTPEREMDEAAQKAHGFNYDFLRQVSLPRKVAVVMFNHFIRRSELLIAHNIEFDFGVLRTAYFREGVPDTELLNISKFCTMRSSTDVCKIPSDRKPGTYKWPSQMEAYKHLVDPNGFQGAHNAAADVAACTKIFYALQDLGVAPSGNR